MGSKDTIFSLSDEELATLSDITFFIKKRNLTTRIMELLGHLETAYEPICLENRSILPEQIFKRRGKISKGENYKGLPYVILDYPACFSKDGVFAYRSLMWWGNPFSFTFHFAGVYLEQYLDQLFNALPLLNEKTLICINESQWEHHHHESNYIPVKEFIESDKYNIDYFSNTKFLKLSRIIPIDQHDQLQTAGTVFLREILTKLS